jgi:DNA adenine methylase
MTTLPFRIGHVGVPPIKCQGIKTKLVPFILENIQWEAYGQACWIEPFLGSGVVAFNLAPQRALLADTNRHIIALYQAIQRGELGQEMVRTWLLAEGKKLAAGGADYYYQVRERFNKEGAPLDFLFLNRSCFNGVMRFNRQGEFNVPFGHKPQRFTQAYITKIVNQVGWVARQIRGKAWEFRVSSWEAVLAEAQPDDFAYLDPPYIGRYTDYYNTWDEAQAAQLAQTAQALPCGFALSMWLENRYRKNTHLDTFWSGLEMRICRHFYHVGSSEDYRNEMDEALVLKAGFAAPTSKQQYTRETTSTNEVPLLSQQPSLWT